MHKTYSLLGLCTVFAYRIAAELAAGIQSSPALQAHKHYIATRQSPRGHVVVPS